MTRKTAATSKGGATRRGSALKSGAGKASGRDAGKASSKSQSSPNDKPTKFISGEQALREARSESGFSSGDASSGAASSSDASSGAFDTIVHEGDMITFGPTGEKLRVSRIAHGEITFEKFP